MNRLAITLAALVLPGLAAAANYEIDPVHSTAQFSVRHLGVSNVRGEFTKVAGTVNLDDKDVTKSTVEATIDATTINTRNTQRDEHLRSADFFDAANHPNITFKSTQVKKAGKDKFKVTGDLTIRGVTKPVVLDVDMPSLEVKDPYGNIKRGATATTKINRFDYGLKWNKAVETGGLVVGETVTITLDIQLTKKPGDAAQAQGGSAAQGQAKGQQPAAAPGKTPAAQPEKKGASTDHSGH